MLRKTNWIVSLIPIAIGTKTDLSKQNGLREPQADIREPQADIREPQADIPFNCFTCHPLVISKGNYLTLWKSRARP